MRLQIEKAVYGGSGLAHTPPGRAVFVPFTLPHETVDAELSPGRSEPLRAELRHVEEASPDRVSPRCRHFGLCGGCQYQHASYPAQLLMKRLILSETLGRAGLQGLPEIEEHAGDPWEYRNRVRLRVSADPTGTINVGYNLRDSDRFLPIGECPISAPLLWRGVETLLALAAERALAADWLRAAAEVELSCTNDQTRLHVLVLLRDRCPKNFQAFWEGLRARLPELAGAAAAVESAPGRRVGVPGAAKGAEGLPMMVAGRSYWVSRGGFFQVNRGLSETLVSLVTRDRRGDLAWDLFAGVGLFARVLAEAFHEVVAVEASPTASGDLARAKVAGVRTVSQPALTFLRQAALERDRPELVVLDPPRAGLGREGSRLLCGIGPREIVYVSCDPTTLGRDLRTMVDSGYNLAELHLVDLFPQTFHLETVTVLQRA